MFLHSYKYFIVARLTLSDIFEYRFDNLSRIGRYAFMVSFMLFLWMAIAKETTIAQLNLEELVRYYVAAIIIYGVSNYHLDYLENDIRLGYISKYLLKPVSAFGHYFTHQGTVTVYDVLVKLVAFAPFIIFLYGFEGGSLLHTGITVLLLISGFFTTFSLYYCFSILAFWFQQVGSLRMTALFLGRYLSGILVPFYLFPDALQRFLWWSPFPHFAFTPIGLVTGRVEPMQALQGLIIMTVWGTLFFLCSKYIWHKATHAYESTGI
jgi:ABC-2 type transport system permease protein